MSDNERLSVFLLGFREGIDMVIDLLDSSENEEEFTFSFTDDGGHKDFIEALENALKHKKKEK